jgi:two-component system CheB/CheR fusion protein
MTKPRSRKKQKPAAIANLADGAAFPTFPIVGIGASAGGLEALEIFLKCVPRNSGLAFVIVQHLDPTHKGILPELLQRATDMPVGQIQDCVKVEPDHVYVIPPDRDLSILHGVLHLFPPAAPRGLRLPIDFFFRSLADDRKEQSIGVMLSGMGSDGTLGLRAIKEKAGAVFVQDPVTAKFDSMPRSAIETGLADVVAPADQLAVRIINYLRHIPPLLDEPKADQADKDQTELQKVILILRTQTGHDFSLYKKSTVNRRIERRMGLHQLTKFADYVRYLRENPQESKLLFKELLVGVTSFFRDPPAWDQLKAEVIPALLKARPGGGVFRAWTPGCTTGEEAYSLAIIFKEALETIKPTNHFSLQVFATDLDKDAVNRARMGAYTLNIAADVSEARLRRFFVQEKHGYRVGKDIREMVIFAPQDLIMDPPFTKLDLLICRNVLIYLSPELQKKLMPLFHYSLNPHGFLFLGSAETVGSASEFFTALPGKNRLYRRLNMPPRLGQVEFPATFAHAQPGTAEDATVRPTEGASSVTNLQTQADRLILRRFAPAAVLVTDHGDILYVNGKTGKYLEPAAGKANWNLLAMARDGLSHALNEGFRRATAKKTQVSLHGVEVGTNGGTQFVDILIQPLDEPVALRGLVLVVFTDVAAPPATKKLSKSKRTSTEEGRVATLERKLRETNETLHTTQEEMQTSMEELKSTNEELQSINEELQSTNEEMTTSREEMQSMNEELQTVNNELQAKNSELTLASDDMKNLLNSTDIAILFLDGHLNVRRFTTQTANIIKLIPGDAGRPITDLVNSLDYPDLADDAREVLRTLAVREKQVSTRDGRWFTVRIMPYRTQDNRIDGLVITFTDISLSKQLEAELRKVHGALEERFSQQTAQLDQATRQLPGSEQTGESP